MPVLSKICPVCGYVEESDGGNNMGVGELVDALETNLHQIKSIPPPSFGKSMGGLTFIMFPILAVYMLLIAIISEAGLFWLLFILFLILGIVAIARKAKGKLGNDKFNRRFDETVNEFEYNKRTAERSFGKDREVAKLIGNISSEIDAVRKKRKSAAGRNMAVWALILVIFFALGGFWIYKTDRMLNPGDGVETNAVQGWQAIVERVKGMSQEDPGIEQMRIDAVSAMLASGEAAEAEKFFTGYCMGNMQDYDCAALIVNYYMGRSDTDSAEKFVERCNGMRYKSDAGKLRNLIK